MPGSRRRLASGILAILLPLSLALGSVLIAMAADGLGMIRVKETYLSGVLGTGLVLLYASVLWLFLPDPRSDYAALYLTLVVFGLNGLGFATAAVTPLAVQYPAVERFFTRHGRNIVIADMKLTVVSLSMLWLAVVGLV